VTATGTPPAPAQVLHETVVQRLVFPVGDDGSTMPLYVECTEGAARLAELVRDRGTIVVPPGERLSFAGYFNAFPASYWRRWTGRSRRAARAGHRDRHRDRLPLERARQPAAGDQRAGGHRFGYLSFELPLAPFGDGGWYWFEVSGGHEESIVEWAEWVVETERVAQGRVTVAITTFNRPADCVALLESLVAAEETMDRIDRVVVVDQGTQLVAEQPGFERAASRADGKVDIVRQPNLGGPAGLPAGCTRRPTAATAATCCCSTTTCSSSRRASCAGWPSRTSSARTRSSVGTCSTCSCRRCCTPSARR
jgi:galactofuranosylgalactofuranosylrhamnosyl-N-acetylglucosaminyl-diphospho-decaprenol beta-1,5/1,6-galactofuranosyltransferase